MISALPPSYAASSPAVSAAGSARAPAAGRTAGTEVTSGFSPAELRQLAQLRAADRDVRAHELAHMAVGGGLTGGVSFTYQVGPDKQRYAVGGEVSVDVSPGKDPEATIAKAQQIRAAALAPADPSPQDHKVAAMAAEMESTARQALAVQSSADERGPRPTGALAAYQAAAAAPRPAGFSALA